MPDINEGLEIDGQPAVTYEDGDVNTDAGFQASLGRAVGAETEAPPEEPQPDEPQPEEETAAYWRERYENMEQVLGRQGQELGELRQLAAQAQYQAPPQQTGGPLDIDAMIEEHGGNEVVNWAIDNAPEQLDQIIENWALSGDPAGVVYHTKYVSELTKGQMAPQPQEQDPALEQLATQQKLTEVWAEARKDPAFASYEAGIGPALESEDTPLEIKTMLISGNPDHMRSAVNFLKPYAQLKAIEAGIQPEAPTPVPAPQGTPAEDQRRELIRRTAIVTGSQRLADAGAPSETGEMTRDQRVAEFKKQFMEVPSTDIQSGLTINGRPVVPPPPDS